jgi:L-fuconolactonase
MHPRWRAISFHRSPGRGRFHTAKIHSGSPVGHSSYRGHEKEVHDNWLRDMKEFAACPNASIKLGGILMTLAAFDFGAAERPATSEELAALWRPYIEPCFELFGPERCMVSSN